MINWNKFKLLQTNKIHLQKYGLYLIGLIIAVLTHHFIESIWWWAIYGFISIASIDIAYYWGKGKW